MLEKDCAHLKSLSVTNKHYLDIFFESKIEWSFPVAIISGTYKYIAVPLTYLNKTVCHTKSSHGIQALLIMHFPLFRRKLPISNDIFFPNQLGWHKAYKMWISVHIWIVYREIIRITAVRQNIEISPGFVVWIFNSTVSQSSHSHSECNNCEVLNLALETDWLLRC